jgi:PKD repeat protein
MSGIIDTVDSTMTANHLRHQAPCSQEAATNISLYQSHWVFAYADLAASAKWTAYNLNGTAWNGYVPPSVVAPVANFTTSSLSGTISQGGSWQVNFTDTSTNTPTNQSWDLNNDSIVDAYGSPVSRNFTASGNYTFCLKASNSAGEDWENKTLTITLTIVQASFTYSENYLNVTFTDNSSNAIGWFWEFGDGTNSTIQNATHLYAADGTYQVNLTVNNSAVTHAYSENITVAAIVVTASFSYSVNCLIVQFTDTSTNALGWLWDFGDSSNSTDQNPMHTYLAVGSFLVSLTVNNSNVTDSVTHYISVLSVLSHHPRVTIIEEENGWLKVQYDFAWEGNESFLKGVQWNFGDGNGSKDFNPVHQYDHAGTYTVTVVLFDEIGNAGYTTREITVGEPDKDQTQAYIDYWLNERLAGVVAVIIISFALAALYVYIADKQWGGANRVFPVAIIAMGLIVALLVFGGN